MRSHALVLHRIGEQVLQSLAHWTSFAVCGGPVVAVLWWRSCAGWGLFLVLAARDQHVLPDRELACNQWLGCCMSSLAIHRPATSPPVQDEKPAKRREARVPDHPENWKQGGLDQGHPVPMQPATGQAHQGAEKSRRQAPHQAREELYVCHKEDLHAVRVAAERGAHRWPVVCSL